MRAGRLLVAKRLLLYLWLHRFYMCHPDLQPIVRAGLMFLSQCLLLHIGVHWCHLQYASVLLRLWTRSLLGSQHMLMQ